MFTIAHLSDTHFGVHPEVGTRTRRVLDHLAAMDPLVDTVLVTGDITDHGTETECAEAREVLGSWRRTPMHLCPGNHDVRETYARILRGQPAGRVEPLNEAYEVHNDSGTLRLLMLDSMITAEGTRRIDHGHLTDSTLAWLRNELDAHPATPTLVCEHHPPVDLHLGLMDPIKLDNADAFAAAMQGHDQVLAVLCGHAHTQCATTFAGRPLLVGGATASTVPLDAEDLPVITPELPPTFAIHQIGDDGRVVTHWRALGGGNLEP